MTKTPEELQELLTKPKLSAGDQQYLEDRDLLHHREKYRENDFEVPDEDKDWAQALTTHQLRKELTDRKIDFELDTSKSDLVDLVTQTLEDEHEKSKK